MKASEILLIDGMGGKPCRLPSPRVSESLHEIVCQSAIDAGMRGSEYVRLAVAERIAGNNGAGRDGVPCRMPIPWRDVSKELPRSGETLICWLGNGTMQLGSRKKGMNCWDFDCGVIGDVIVTHWCYGDEFCEAVCPVGAPILDDEEDN